MKKPKVAFYWCASCGGCEEAVVDLALDLLDVAAAVDIVFWPVALDFKRSDVEALQDQEITVSFVNGAVRTSEQAEMAQLLRRKSQLIVAFGSCAHLGGIPGLANLCDLQGILEQVFIKAPSLCNPEGVIPEVETAVPEGTLTLPELWGTVNALDRVIPVDYYLPGCPPPVALIKDAIDCILKAALPPKGAILAPDVALCEECPRKDSKPDRLMVKEFRRPHEVRVDPEQCLLAQGLLCLGPVTRKGCGAACVAAHMPCTGCMGATGHVVDFGAKALSAVASLIDSREEAEIRTILDAIVDPAGTFYRYSMPVSLVHRSLQASANGGEQG